MITGAVGLAVGAAKAAKAAKRKWREHKNPPLDKWGQPRKTQREQLEEARKGRIAEMRYVDGSDSGDSLAHFNDTFDKTGKPLNL